MSLVVFSEEAFFRALAIFALCRFCETASRTNVSPEQFIIDLRPCLGFVFSPKISPVEYLFVQLKEGMETFSFCETSALENFPLLRRITRHDT